MRVQILSAMLLLTASLAFASEIERVMAEPNPVIYTGRLPQGIFINVSVARTHALDVSTCQLQIDPGDQTGLRQLVIQPFRTPERIFHQYQKSGIYRLRARGTSGCRGEKSVDVIVQQGTGLAGASSGGVAFQRNCPAGEVLVGLAGRTGDVIDQIQMVCATLSNDQTAARARPNAGELRGEAAGGTGGRPNQADCPRSEVIIGLQIGLNTPASDPYWAHVRTIGLVCGTLQPVPQRSGESRSIGPSTPSPVNLGEIICPPDAPIAVGIHGRATNYLKAIGLLCASDSE